jgi:hypothetical protein
MVHGNGAAWAPIPARSMHISPSGLAALRLGAARVLGIDIDPRSGSAIGRRGASAADTARAGRALVDAGRQHPRPPDLGQFEGVHERAS